MLSGEPTKTTGTVRTKYSDLPYTLDGSKPDDLKTRLLGTNYKEIICLKSVRET